jgi:hypothetical protein
VIEEAAVSSQRPFLCDDPQVRDDLVHILTQTQNGTVALSFSLENYANTLFL